MQWRTVGIVALAALGIGGVFALGHQTANRDVGPIQMASATNLPVGTDPKIEQMKAEAARVKAGGKPGGLDAHFPKSASAEGNESCPSNLVGTWEGSSIGGAVSLVLTAEGKAFKLYAGMTREAKWSVGGDGRIAFKLDNGTVHVSLISPTQMDFGGTLLTKKAT